MHLISFTATTKNCARGSQRHPRMSFSVPVMLHHLVPGGVRFTHGITLDISEGGLGALVESGPGVGQTVSLKLELADYDLNAVAIVRHSSSSRSGFEFVGLTAEERQHIARLVGST